MDKHCINCIYCVTDQETGCLVCTKTGEFVRDGEPCDEFTEE